MYVEFVIDATPTQFYNWLRAHTQKHVNAGMLDFYHQHGQISLRQVKTESTADPHSAVTRLCIRGHQFLPVGPGTVEVAGGWDGQEYIHFNLVPLNKERTEITARCGVPLAQPYFRLLLESISDRYPMAAEDITLAIFDPTVGLAESLESLLRKTIQPSWQGVVDCPLNEFSMAAERHLLGLAFELPPPETSLQITRDYILNPHFFADYTVITATTPPPSAATAVPATQPAVIGRIRGSYYSSTQTCITVDMVRSYNVQFAHLVTRFITDWRDALEPPLLPAGNTEPALALATPPLSEPATEKPAWEQIPDNADDRQIVKLLWDGLTDEEIGRSIGYSAKSVSNRLSELRREYPDQVPTRDRLRQMGVICR